MADSVGSWTFDYTGTALPEGVTAFAATESSAAATSAFSPDFLVTVDLTPPTVTLAAASPTNSLGPQVSIDVTDKYGIPNGTTFTLDVDLHDNGTFTDYVVSGRSKPATNGRFKTGHFEEMQIEPVGFPGQRVARGTCHGESAPSGRD